MYSGSLFTNSYWFAFEDDRVAKERSTGSLASPSPNTEGGDVINGGSDDNVIVGEDDELVDTATFSPDQDTLKLINHLNGLNGGRLQILVTHLMFYPMMRFKLD